LSCTFLDKETLEKTFEANGISRDNVERFDERKPGFWDLFKTDRARYLHFMKGAVYECVHSGQGIILGRGGQVVLGDLPGVLHARIIAPEELRIQRIMKRFECDEKHALKILQHSDNERAGFHKFFFDQDWEDLGLYDLVINTGSFSVASSARMIEQVVESDEFKTRQEATRHKLEALCLEYEVKTGIVYRDKILVQFLEVIARHGEVTLRGIVENKEDIDNCEKVAAALDGVKEVRNEIYFSPISATYGIHY
jgi:hypothetical protein